MQPTEATEHSLEERIEYTKKVLEQLEAEKELIDAAWQVTWENGERYWHHPNFSGTRFFEIETASKINKWQKQHSSIIAALKSLVLGMELGGEAHIIGALRMYRESHVDATVITARLLHLASVILDED